MADVSDKPWFVRNPAITSQEESNLIVQFNSRQGALLAVDDLVGRVVETLESLDELDNTVIVFTSDHGYFLGQHRLSLKGYAYEEAARIPLHIPYPGQAAENVEQLVLNTDLAPTILAMAAMPANRSMDERSLLPLIEGVDPPVWRKLFLMELTWYQPAG